MTSAAVPTIQSITFQNVSFPLLKPFVTAAGRKAQTDNVQITLALSNGLRGLAEASSSIAMPGESQAAMTRVLTDMMPELRGKAIDDYRSLVAITWRFQSFHPTAAAAMECALLDAYCRWKAQPLCEFFGGRMQRIETDFTLSAGSPEAMDRAARAASRRGFRRLKLKLPSASPAENAQRVQAVHQAAPRALLIADGNQGFVLSQALELIRLLERRRIHLVFFVQPFRRHDVRAMRLFRQRCRVPLFADESVLTAADALRLFEAEAADGLNIKVAKSGLLGALDIIQMARRYDKRLAIGCMEESKLGLAASVHLACGTGAFEWTDLDSVFLLKASNRRGGFLIKGPRLSVEGIGPGIGM